MEEGNSTDPVNVENTNQTTGAEGGNEQAATAAPDTGAKQQDLESSLKDNFLNQAKESEAGDGEKPAEDDKEADKDKKEQPEGAPESYEDFKTPSGQQLDVQLSDSFKEAAKEDPVHTAQPVVGEGAVDMRGVFGLMNRKKIGWAVLEVEQYPCGEAEYLRRSLENMKKLAK